MSPIIDKDMYVERLVKRLLFIQFCDLLRASAPSARANQCALRYGAAVRNYNSEGLRIVSEYERTLDDLFLLRYLPQAKEYQQAEIAHDEHARHLKATTFGCQFFGIPVPTLPEPPQKPVVDVWTRDWYRTCIRLDQNDRGHPRETLARVCARNTREFQVAQAYRLVTPEQRAQLVVEWGARLPPAWAAGAVREFSDKPAQQSCWSPTE